LLKFTRLEVRITPAPDDDSTVIVNLAGAATFLRLPIPAAQLEQVPHDVDVRIKINRLTYMDNRVAICSRRGSSSEKMKANTSRSIIGGCGPPSAIRWLKQKRLHGRQRCRPSRRQLDRVIAAHSIAYARHRWTEVSA
jgi:hypothetical protein